MNFLNEDFGNGRKKLDSAVSQSLTKARSIVSSNLEVFSLQVTTASNHGVMHYQSLPSSLFLSEQDQSYGRTD